MRNRWIHFYGGPKHDEWLQVSYFERTFRFPVHRIVPVAMVWNDDPIAPLDYETVYYDYVGEYRGSNGQGACYQIWGGKELRVETAGELIRMLSALKPNTQVIVEDTRRDEQGGIIGIEIQQTPGMFPSFAHPEHAAGRAVIKTR